MIRTFPMLVLAVLICAPAAASARGKHHKEKRHHRDGGEHAEMLEHWRDSLRLDDKQHKAIEEILQKQQEESARERAAMKKLHEKMEKLEKRLHRGKLETHEKIREVLSLEQRERFDSMRMERRRHEKRRRIKIKKKMRHGPERDEYRVIEEKIEGGWDGPGMHPPEMWEGEDGPGHRRYRWHEEGEDGGLPREFEVEIREEDD